MTFDEAHRIIKKGELVALRQALDEGMSPSLANQLSWSLLMLAAIEGNVSIGSLLISRGATLDVTNNFGETALSIAAHEGHASFVRALLRSGASKECRPHGCGLEDHMKSSGLPQDRITAILDIIQSG